MLSIDPALDGMTDEHHVFLAERQLLSVSYANLFTYKINARDHLCDRVLDLQARVHLDEIEVSVFIKELHRARAQIADLCDGLGDDRADLFTLRLVQGRRGRLFENLLVAALQRTIAFPQMRDVSMAVGDHLDFDMARLAEILLEIDGIVAKGSLGFGLRCTDGVLKVFLGLGDLHAPPAAASSGLHEHRIADLLGDLLRFADASHTAIGPWNTWHASIDHRLLGGDFVAHGADVLGFGANEDQPVRLDHFGELRVLRKKAVAGVNRIGIGDFGCRQDA